MPVYKRRVDTVTAIQVTAENVDALKAFAGDSVAQVLKVPPRILLQTPNGELEVHVGDWIAQNPGDPTDFYPIAAEQFDKLYNPVPIG